MAEHTLKGIRESLGAPLFAILIATAIFVLPRFIFESISYYKDVGHSIGEKLK